MIFTWRFFAGFFAGYRCARFLAGAGEVRRAQARMKEQVMVRSSTAGLNKGSTRLAFFISYSGSWLIMVHAYTAVHERCMINDEWSIVVI